MTAQKKADSPTLMSETRKLAAILVADVVGYSRLAGADEDRILARLRTLRSDLIDPTIAVHHGRVVKRTGDGSIVEFRSVVDAVRCAIEVQNGMRERNAGVADDQKIQFRVGVHLGDVVEEEDGDLMGDGVNIAARLEGVAKPGAICLSEDAYRQVKARLDLKVTDLGATQLKNIAEPVRVYELQVGAVAKAQRSTQSDPASSERSAPPRLSIVVLPFANISGDPEQDYFVDGVTESLTTDLSRIANSFVIARNTAFAYKGKPLDVKQIGRELGVRYVLEGSVQRGGNHMRVNVQLIDAATGNHLWAERFDKQVADLFDMQDEIVSRVANQLRAELIAVEAQRAEKEPNPDSMDLYFQGVALFNQESPTTYAQARIYFERAVALDPGNIDALVGTARVDAVLGAVYSFDDRAERLAAAEATLTRVLSIAPNNVWALFWMGFVQIMTNRGVHGIAELQRALALNPNLAHAHAFIGRAKMTIGRAEETEAHVNEAFRLSPREGAAFVWNYISGGAKLHLGADEEAVARLRQSIEASRNYPRARFFIAAALAHLGKLDEARSEVNAGLALDPKFSIYRFRVSAESDNPTYLAQRERIIDGLRNAGAPEE
jgi:TolB-like protein/class 3 adenylate cyclase/cytochrome c-type biogenesis protein CcmH/NrfG